MSVFVLAKGIKTVHAGGGVKKWQNSVHVVVECPLRKENVGNLTVHGCWPLLVMHYIKKF